VVKPTDVERLIQSIKDKLRQREPHQPLTPKRIASILRERLDEIVELALAKMKASAELQCLHLSDSQRVDHLPRLIENMARAMESHEFPAEIVSAAAEHGRLRLTQKYSAPQLVEDVRAVDEAIYETVQKNLLSVDLSHLIADLGIVNSTLETQLRESLKAYTSKAA
jgi:hypothetical protein